MKNKLLLLAFFLLLSNLEAQITLVKEFPDDVIRKIIPNEGEKYALLNQSAHTIEIYNGDFSLDQSVPLTSYFNVNVSIELYDFSKNLFFNDDGWEFLLTWHYDNSYNQGWFNESIEKVAEGGNVVTFNDKKKLMSEKSVYSVPSATLEHVYDNYPSLLKLSTGNYYQIFDLPTKTVFLYNEQHQLVKTFTPDLCFDCTTSHPYISDNVFNNDTLLEFYVTMYQPTGLQKQVIVNENGLELFSIQTSVNSVAIPIIATKEQSGLSSNKLMIYDYYQPSTKVYDLPSFSLENIYTGLAYPGDINSKIKGNYVNRILPSEYDLYYSNHEYYKSLNNFKIPNADPTNAYFCYLTDSLFNFDANLEAIVNYYYHYGGCEAPDLKSKLMAEDGTILFDFPPDCNCGLSQLPNASTKIKCRSYRGETYFYDLPKPTVTNSEVKQEELNSFLCIPNPIQGEKLWVELPEKPNSEIFVRIYSADGRNIASFEVPSSDRFEIKTDYFPYEGLYFLEIVAEGKRFVSKIQK
jgi:hypothetical protein